VWPRAGWVDGRPRGERSIAELVVCRQAGER